MAEADWTYLNDGLDIATVDRGVTAGIARPPGGGSFLYAFNSLAAVDGAVALFALVARTARVGDDAIEPAEVGSHALAGSHAPIVLTRGRIEKSHFPSMQPADHGPPGTGRVHVCTDFYVPAIGVHCG